MHARGVESFPSVLDVTLRDPRGWSRAGFRLVHDQTATYRVVVAEAAEVDALCRPYDTYGKYSCQNGPVVARDGHFYAGDKRIRFVGVNIAFAGNFPRHEQADALSKRFANFGRNSRNIPSRS